MRMKTNITVSLRVETSGAWCGRRAHAGGSVLALTASAASADMACNYPPGSNTCLTIEPVPGGWYARQAWHRHKLQVRTGVPILPRRPDLIAAAQAAGQPVFTVQIWGEDGRDDHRLFDLRDYVRRPIRMPSTGSATRNLKRAQRGRGRPTASSSQR